MHATPSVSKQRADGTGLGAPADAGACLPASHAAAAGGVGGPQSCHQRAHHHRGLPRAWRARCGAAHLHGVRRGQGYKKRGRERNRERERTRDPTARETERDKERNREIETER